MPLPIFDGDAIELRLNEDRYHSGGLVAAVDGSLLTWTVNIGVKGNRAVYDSSQTRDVDTVAHEAGTASGLNLSIRAKPTYTIDIDQLTGGNVIVSWVEPLSPGSNSYFRIYDSLGHAVAPKTELQGLGNPEFMTARITALSNGGFCSTWGDYRNGSGDSFVQVFNADGLAVAPAARMNPALAGDQGPLGAVALGDDAFLTLYSDRPSNGEQSVKGRVFSTLGTAMSKAFVVMTATSDDHVSDVNCTALANGDIVVTWRIRSFVNPQPESLHARILQPNGNPVGPEFTIATASGLESDEFGLDASSLVALDDGRWMVAWTDQRFDSLTFARSSQLFGRIFNADGSVDQDTFDLALRPDYISAVQLDVLADGRVAVRYDTGYINQAPHAYVQIIDPRLDAVFLTGTNSGDQFQGTSLADTIEGGSGKDKIAGMSGDDRLGGGSKSDSLIGGEGNDKLAGGADNDTLLGGAGNDALNGGSGDDQLTGGLGRDSFVFAPTSGHDRVTDFKPGQDLLDLSAFDFAAASEALSHLSQGAQGAEFTLGADTILLLGIDATTLGAAALTL